MPPPWRADDHALLTWGGPLARPFGASELLGASDHDLRGLDCTLAAFAAVRGGARLVTGCAGATALYAARSTVADAWSTHAVAAGYLAHGLVALDPCALPELFAAEFVGGRRTHLRGVEAIPAATVIDFSPSRAATRSYWSERERYAPMPTRESFAVAEGALLGSVQHRLASTAAVELGLTAGADSRVAAVALREVGLRFEAMTVAPTPEAADARGAASVARALGVPHRVYGYDLVPDEDGPAFIDAEARWSEGLAPLNGFGTAEHGSPDVIVTGNGGETARGWYYRWQARNHKHPTPRQLAQVLAHVHWRIEAASPDAHMALNRAVDEWIAGAYATGHAGWPALDIVYEEQRLRRWGRGRLARARAPLVYAFSTPELTRAFVSLPLEDRISDGFHRRFLARHAPELAIPAPPTQRRGIPSPARRFQSALRRRRGLDHDSHDPSFLAHIWNERPLTRAYIADEVLHRPILQEAMGERLVDQVRAGFLAGEDHATQAAFLATGIAALDIAVSQLGRHAAASR